jgi:uncharacterized protein
MGITINLIIAVVIFLILLVGLYFLSRKALSGDARYMENLEQAALRGDVYSQFKLGQIYFEGDGIDRNDEEAAQWFQKAAQQEHAEAQYILGTMFEKGTGVKKNDAEAFKWFSKAASQGHERSLVILDSGKWSAFMPMRVDVGEPLPHVATDEKLHDEEIHAETAVAPSYEANEQEQKYLTKADQGDVDAQYNLGIMYYHGEGVAKDIDKALHWFQMAAEQEDADAQYNLGLMHGKGEGTGKDHRKSIQWFKKAADQGHAGAKEILEKMLKKS